MLYCGNGSILHALSVVARIRKSEAGIRKADAFSREERPRSSVIAILATRESPVKGSQTGDVRSLFSDERSEFEERRNAKREGRKVDKRNRDVTGELHR